MILSPTRTKVGGEFWVPRACRIKESTRMILKKGVMVTIIKGKKLSVKSKPTICKLGSRSGSRLVRESMLKNKQSSTYYLYIFPYLS